MDFYLGTHQPHWLRKLDVPMMVSHRRLRHYKTLPVAQAGWMLDSGGFSELSMFGEWTVSETDYVKAARRYVDETGKLEFASVQDWMCEPFIINKTGLTVKEHQHRTIMSWLSLNMRDPSLPWFPVLQGFSMDDYLRHLEMYDQAGVELQEQQRVGLGSVCRRQATGEIRSIVHRLSVEGLLLHGFGMKKQGLEASGMFLASADSMAWRFNARRVPPLEGCSHKTCNNCIKYAMKWRNGLASQNWGPRDHQTVMAI